jgi:hypothetical protein
MHLQLFRRRPTAWGHSLRERSIQDDVVGVNNAGFTLSQPLTLTIKNVPVASQPGVLAPTSIVDSSPPTTAAPVQPTNAAASPPNDQAPPPADGALSTITTTTSTTLPSTPSSTLLPSSTGRPQVSESNQALASKGLSTGTLAGIIVAGAVVILAILAFFIRKRYIKNRRRKTLTWGAGILSKPISSADMIFNNTGPVSTAEDTRRAQQQYHQQAFSYDNSDVVSPGSDFARQQITAIIAPPPMSYNNPVPPSVLGLQSPGLMSPTASTGTTAAAVAATRAGPTPPSSAAATVQCTFIPTLPDELSISTGETVRVLGEYDDGWALCVNGKGEQGMVPLECLDRGEPAVRNSRRASSLIAGGGRYQY